MRVILTIVAELLIHIGEAAYYIYDKSMCWSVVLDKKYGLDVWEEYNEEKS